VSIFSHSGRICGSYDLGGLGVQKAKIKAISQVPQPTNGSRLQAFLGLCNYYWRFVEGFNNIAKFLT
jgi:hypothetical protein